MVSLVAVDGEWRKDFVSRRNAKEREERELWASPRGILCKSGWNSQFYKVKKAVTDCQYIPVIGHLIPTFFVVMGLIKSHIHHHIQFPLLILCLHQRPYSILQF